MLTTLYKPSGLPVFPPHKDPQGDCVLRLLLDREPWRREVPWPEGFNGGIAHRLDVATSGALVVADDVAALARIRDDFSSGRLSKTYRFQAARSVSWDDNLCERAIAHAKGNKRKMVVQRGANTPHRGRWYPAHSVFERISGDLWRVRITTGVMHQIRVHAAFLGLPLLGDRLYGGGSPDHQDEGFRLHHVGLRGPTWQTEPVPMPNWADPDRSRSERGR